MRIVAISIVLAVGALTLIGPVVSADKADQPSDAQALPNGPLEPRESFAAMRLNPGFRIELVACEPQVIDPVAIRFDERGRMWVAEMRDYPHGPKPGEAPSSTIKILEDQDGDGFFETATVFADKLMFANGIQPWRTGVIATVGGKVVYMPDDDGDRKADRVETWYEGFAQENSQLRANHPTLAIDNRIYVANGLRGGKVVDARTQAAKPVSISGMDFRFDPLRGAYEAVSGVGQFGLTFDEDGRRFVCTNRNPVKHIVLPNEYLRRNPAAPASQVANDVAVAGAESKLYPISRAWTTSTLHAGQFTAACGVTIYSGDLSPELSTSAFTCDPTGNLVHRELMKPAGGSFVSHPAREGVEFLASSDEWFRPVNLSNGPEGALYVVDMYRAVIEHPQFVPEELKNRPDQRFGDDLGRVYRIVPAKSKPAKPTRLGGLSNKGLSNKGLSNKGLSNKGLSNKDLVKSLDSKNGWTRETAARLILQQEDDSIASALREACRDDAPRAWARSLWLLNSLKKLDKDLLSRSLASRHAAVQIQALRLASTRLDENIRAEMRGAAQATDSLVRYQLALSLTPATRADVDALTQIAIAEPADSWTRQAVALAAGREIEAVAVAVLDRLIARDMTFDDSTTELAKQLVELAARQAPLSKPLRTAVRNITDQDAAQVIAYAMLRGAARSRVSVQQLRSEDEAFAKTLDRIFESARVTAQSPKAASNQKAAAIGLLAISAEEESKKTLAELARGAKADQATRILAINALIGLADDTLSLSLIKNFPAESPAVRRALLDHALARSTRISLLLNEIDAGRIKVGEIDRVRTNRLLAVKSADLKQRIKKVFADAIPQDRKKVLVDYQPVLALKADPSRGELIFRKNCATCHRVGKWGVDVAPDIADSRTRKPVQLLTDILQPNRAIDSNYVSYSVISADGRSFTGVLDVETSGSVTLKLPEGKRVTLARTDIDEMRSNGVSLMPEGLEKNINKQEMADLISYIKNWRYLDGRTPYGK